jgi:hypothetical protein
MTERAVAERAQHISLEEALRGFLMDSDMTKHGLRSQETVRRVKRRRTRRERPAV